MSTSPTPSTRLTELFDQLNSVMLRDENRLQRRISGARKIRDPQRLKRIIEQIATDVDTAAQRLTRRKANVPTISYPAELPISQRKDDILSAIRDHQVVIIAGETGSGKTTQLPKICLELGRGVRGLIGHTQPRRIAARATAERIAEELETPLGQAVGYQVRFTDQVSDNTLVKLMTDGILLAEIHHDPLLRTYDTIIIDEAHERSLNIDLLLGYLRNLLPRRPDLKVIITSATIDPERFAEYFSKNRVPAPIIEVSGRTYPVDIRYRPFTVDSADNPDSPQDQTEAITVAVRELSAEGPGDILVFLSGEREIRDTADALAGHKLRDTEILPLYARLSTADQHRVFAPHSGRRIILATNVAETSLTVPGIRYVIDPGFARISRYSRRTKVQRLPIEAISQASAQQRSGRCGRVSDGVCIRLYSEEEFQTRPEFTDPEILRTSLASVLLHMAAAGLGDIESFGFIDPPDQRAVKDGLALLQELGALDATNRLTDIGRTLAQFPVDPRLGRMIIEAGRNGCVTEVIVIAAALSIVDPREYPVEHQQAAREKHARFANPQSDFLGFLALWDYLQEQQKSLSSNQFRRLCRSDFLNYLRIREWQDVQRQLQYVAKNQGITVDRQSEIKEADSQLIHISLLAGLLSHIGVKEADSREYLVARSTRFALSPSSALANNPPRWVVAAELVETTRLWAHTAAKIDPQWIEPLAQHLIVRQHSEPRWNAKRGAVVATERVTLYGIPIVAARTVNFGSVDPELSRELFIRHALINGEWDTHHRFFHQNQALIEKVQELESRARRRDILVDDEILFDFYDQRIGTDVVSTRHFDTWWKKTRQQQPDLLNFSESMLTNPVAESVTEADYPDEWTHHNIQLPLRYQFEPGTQTDGVSIDIPLKVLNQVESAEFDWHIPGMREELITALIRSLPKDLRRNFVPAPNFAQAVVENTSPDDGPFFDVIEKELHRLTGTMVPRDAWQLDRLPEHLKLTFRAVNDTGEVIAQEDDLADLKSQLSSETRAVLTASADQLGSTGQREWTFGTIPQTYETQQNGQIIKGFPTLIDEDDTVGVGLVETPEQQQQSMRQGTRRLLLLTVPSPTSRLVRGLSNKARLALTNSPYRTVEELIADCVACAVDALISQHGGPAWNQDDFASLAERTKAEITAVINEILAIAERILGQVPATKVQLADMASPAFEPAITDMNDQLANLLYPGFISATGLPRLAELPRYIAAIDRRLENLPRNVGRDAELMHSIHQLDDLHAHLLQQCATQHRPTSHLQHIRWMIEELRVSYFAQTLGTAYPISEKRIRRALDEAKQL